MGRPVVSRTLVFRVGLLIAAAGVMLAGSVALVRFGDNYAVGEQGAPPVERAASPVEGIVVSDIKNVPELDPEALLITVPLGVDFQVPGALYGTKAKKPVPLGPKSDKGMTQDLFGSQAGTLLPDGRLLYHFSRQLMPFPTYAPGAPEVADGTPMNTPTLRLCDPSTGEDAELLSGARSVAWRSDGTFAYAKGVDPDYRLNLPYLQHVIVQQGLDGAPEAWTNEAGNYTVMGWARDSLLVSRQHEGEATEVLVFSGPGSSRQVVSEAERFLCVSPDGTQVLVASGGSDPLADPLVVRALDLASGEEASRLSLTGLVDAGTGTKVTAVGSGAWEGDTIALTLTPADLAEVSVRDGSLVLENVITFRGPKLRSGTCSELALAGDGKRVFLVMNEGTDTVELERTALITYDFDSGECTRWIVPGTNAATRLVGNSSRPR